MKLKHSYLETRNHGRRRFISTGPTGPTGETGRQGNPGPIGLTGSKGDAGPVGETGLQGPTGDTGPKGDKGEPGPQGTPGTSGLVSANYQQTILDYTGSDTTWQYPIAYSTGITPVIEAVVATSNVSILGLYNVQVVGTPSNTSCTLRVNVINPTTTATVSLGVVTLNLFTQAPSGVKIHVTARNP